MLFSDQLDRFSPYMLAVLRIVTALLFMEHGTQKLLGFPPGSFPQPPVFSLFGLAGVLEIVGGVMILIGVLHPTSGFHSGRSNGGRLLHWPCPRGVLPGEQRGRRGHPLLLCVSVPRVCWPWSLEHRRAPC